MEIQYEYIALTKYSDYLPDLLRTTDERPLEQYDPETKTWNRAPVSAYGIYTGDVESKAISEIEAFRIIDRWRKQIG